MLVVALIVLVACALVILGALFGDPSQVVTLDFFDIVEAEVTSVGAFLIGLATGAVTMLGLWLLLVGSAGPGTRRSSGAAWRSATRSWRRRRPSSSHKLGIDRTVVDDDPADRPERKEIYGLSTQPRDATDEGSGPPA